MDSGHPPTFRLKVLTVNIHKGFSIFNRKFILHELREEAEWDLPALVVKMSPVDLVLVEGFKRDAFPKLEIHRAANDKPLIYPEDPHIVAIASDVALPQAKIPVIDLDDVDSIADVLLKHAVPVGAAGATASRVM